MNTLIELLHTETTRDLPTDQVPTRLRLRTQDMKDRGGLSKVCEPDRRTALVGYWDGRDLIIEPAGESLERTEVTAATEARNARKAELMAKTPAELQSLAPRVGAKWLVGATKETNVDHIIEAEEKKAAEGK